MSPSNAPSHPSTVGSQVLQHKTRCKTSPFENTRAPDLFHPHPITCQGDNTNHVGLVAHFFLTEQFLRLERCRDARSCLRATLWGICSCDLRGEERPKWLPIALAFILLNDVAKPAISMPPHARRKISQCPHLKFNGEISSFPASLLDGV